MIIAIIIIVIVLIPVIAAASMPEDFEIVADTVINRPVNEVFDYVKYLRNSDHFNKWVMQDPAMRKEYIGVDGTMGFVYKWDSDNKNVGKGEQEIRGIIENERIDYELRFIKPFENVCASSIVLKRAGDHQSTVAWSFSGKRNFAMRIFHFLFNLKKVLHKDLSASLGNLKNILEK